MQAEGAGQVWVELYTSVADNGSWWICILPSSPFRWIDWSVCSALTLRGPRGIESQQPTVETCRSMHSLLILFPSLSHFSTSLSAFSACVCVKSLQLCPALCEPVDCSPPVSSVYGILQARILEWVAIAFSWWEINHFKYLIQRK